MFCENCGAKLEAGQLRCSYCGTENYKEALNLHEEKLEYYQEEEKNITETIQDVKSHKTIVPILIIFAAINCVLQK